MRKLAENQGRGGLATASKPAAGVLPPGCSGAWRHVRIDKRTDGRLVIQIPSLPHCPFCFVAKID